MSSNIIGQFLKTRWYPIFLPRCKVSKFKVSGWKVIVINSGQDAAKPILCRRIVDDKEMYIGYNDLLTRFINEKTFIDMARHYGYKLSHKIDGQMTFEPSNSKA